MSYKRVKVEDISKPARDLSPTPTAELKPLPAPFDKQDELPERTELSERAREKFECDLDGTTVLSYP